MSLGFSCGMLTHGWSLVIEYNMCVMWCQTPWPFATCRFLPFSNPCPNVCVCVSVFATLNNCCHSKNGVCAAIATRASCTGWPICCMQTREDNFTHQGGRLVDIIQRQSRFSTRSAEVLLRSRCELEPNRVMGRAATRVESPAVTGKK